MHVTVDDGGVRCVDADGGRYVPFTTLVDVVVEFTLLGVALLRLMTKEKVITLRVSRREALDAQIAILHQFTLPTQRADISEATRMSLTRGGLPLCAWLSRVGEWARSSAGYRSAALDPETAKAILADARADAELRAACVYGMLAAGDEEELEAVARAFAASALPPLVVLAARLGRGGAALVPDGMLDDALAVLPPADVADARNAVASPTTHENEAHIHALLERATRAAISEAEQARPHDVHKGFRARPLGGYASGQGVTRFK